MRTSGRLGALRVVLAFTLLWTSCSPGAPNALPDPNDPNAAGPIPPGLDTDGDGVPDANEDRNQNGTVDPGESDPTKTDSDGDGIPDANEVEYLACDRVNDRKITVLDVPGADAMLMVDAVVDAHAMLKTADGRAPGLQVYDPTTSVAAVLIGKHPSSGVQSPAAQRDSDRRNGLAGLGEDIPGMGLWRCLAGFAMGCTLCLLWRRWQAEPRGGVLAALGCVAVLAIGLGLGLPETAWIPAAFYTGLLALALGRGSVVRLLGGRTLTYLGEISYSTYLAHFLLFILFKLAFVDASLQLGWAGLGGYLGLVLVASVGLYHGLEKPAQRWLNRHPPRWAERPRTQTAG